MATTQLKLVTIIADRLWTDSLAEEILALGATGYTLSEARGQGSRGHAPMDWEGSNVRLEIICPAATAEKILAHVAEHYFDRPGFIAFSHPVEVVRGEKYQ